LGELLAGPLVGTLLGEFGAEVIKVERPGRGDVLRQFGPSYEGEGLYWTVNARNKKSVVLDLGSDAAKPVLGDLIARADVLVNSLRPGTLEGWGFDEEMLRSRHPRLVIVYASAFGRTGPKSDLGGYDPIAQGYSGLSFLTGEADGPPMRAGGAIPVCDFMTGFAGALGAVMALYRRDTGDGRLGASVDVALYDVAFRMLGPLLSLYDLTGRTWKRDGNHSLGGAPTGHFQASDGEWICTSVQNDAQFQRLATLIGELDWLTDERFVSPASRTHQRDAIEVKVTQWISERSREAVLREFSDADLPVGPINSMADLARDDHIGRSTFWSEAGKRRYRQPTRVPKLAGEEEPRYAESPALGEHTLEVLRDMLGYTEERIESLIPIAKRAYG
jgi:formyl-CoA transferase